MTAEQVLPSRSRIRTSSGGAKGELYRQCRKWHAYLSAFAFLALIFFSATGLLLNHPDWFVGERSEPEQGTAVIPRDVLASALRAPDVPRALADAVGQQIALRGAFASGEVQDSTAMIRMDGATGTSDVTVDLTSGRVELSIERADVISILNELHRGTKSGAVWRALIDAVALLVLALSIVGYVLFFSLRFRLRTSLVLTGTSLLVLAGAFFVFVP